MSLKEKITTNPWWVVAGSTLALTVCVGPLVMTTLGFFMAPISEEFGWSRGQISLALTTCSIAAAVTAPFLGRLIDRAGIRRVVIPSLVAFSLCVMLIGFTPASLIMFYIIFTLAGVFSNAANTLPHMKAVSSWFDHKRGFAIGITASGIGIGGILIPLFAEHMIGNYGWRAAYIGLGLLAAIVSIPAVALSLRIKTHPTQDVSDSKDSASVQLPGFTARAARRQPAFWLICAAILLVGTIVNGLQVHLVPLLMDTGLERTSAAGFVALLGMASLLARVLGGYLLDRIHAPYVAAFFFLLPILSLILILNGTMLPLAIVMLGACIGIEVDLMGYMVSRYLGLRGYGEIFGFVMAMFVLGAAFGPLLYGTLFDMTGTYATAVPIVAVALGTAAVLTLFLGKYRFDVGQYPVEAPTATSERPLIKPLP